MGTVKYIFNSKRLSEHKRRFDRGGLYLNYLTGLGMAAIFVKIFNLNAWWVYALGVVLIMTYRYFMGYLDEKKKILEQEQKGYAQENPILMDILNQLKKLNESIGHNHNV